MDASNKGIEMMIKPWMEFGRRWIGLLVAFGLTTLLAACGGGGGGTNGDTNSFAEFRVSPAEVVTGPNTVWTFTLTGGTRPYRAQSSSSLVVLDKETLALNEFSVQARSRDPNGTATVAVTFFDSQGRAVSASVTISSGTVSPLSALPATLTTYFNSPALVTASGGRPPYRLLSSNPAIIPTSGWSDYGDFLVLARNVAADIDMALTLQDSTGQSAEIKVTVKPAPLLNVLTITPVPAAPGVGCGTAVCSGQDATASVSLRGFEGGPLPGRQVRFDVVQGEYLFRTDDPAQPLVNSLTVTSDQNGLAIVRLHANVNAVTGAALIRATDLTTGNQVNGSFVIAQYTSGLGTLSIIPADVKISMYYNDECSIGVSTSYYIFGGTPPYRVVTSFADLIAIEGTPVQTNGGGFVATTRGGCFDPGDLIVTDATGRTLTALLRNVPGEEDRPAIPVPIPPLTIVPGSYDYCVDQPTIPYTITFIISGAASDATFVAATTNPGVTVLVNGRSLSVTIAAGAPANITVLVSDGSQTVTLPISNPATCP